MILRILLVCGFRRFSERSRWLSTARPPAESDSGNWRHDGGPRPIGRLCSSLVARCRGAALPEVCVHTEFFLVRITISPALLQKFRKIDGFERTRRRHIV